MAIGNLRGKQKSLHLMASNIKEAVRAFKDIADALQGIEEQLEDGYEPDKALLRDSEDERLSEHG